MSGIEVGQVWFHHTVSNGYRVESVDRQDGRIGIRDLRTGRSYGVWRDYFRANFTPMPGSPASDTTGLPTGAKRARDARKASDTTEARQRAWQQAHGYGDIDQPLPELGSDTTEAP